MALGRIDTRHFEVVNLSDEEVEHAEGERPNRWVDKASVKAGPTATVIRVRALTGTEVDGAPSPGEATFTRALCDVAVHADDRERMASLPWQYIRTLGAYVFEVSTHPLDRKS
jgi:hypothetical protein